MRLFQVWYQLHKREDRFFFIVAASYGEAEMMFLAWADRNSLKLTLQAIREMTDALLSSTTAPVGTPPIDPKSAVGANA